MSIQYRCESCNNIVQTPDDSGGKKGRCPHCSHIMEIPLHSTASPLPNAGVASPAKPQPQNPTGNPFADPQPQMAASQPFIQPQQAYGQPTYPGNAAYSPMGAYGNENWSDKSKLAAGLLGIFVGGWGVHRFYLGFVGIGFLQIFVSIITCGIGGLWGFIEGILYLTGSMDRDVYGRKLRD